VDDSRNSDGSRGPAPGRFLAARPVTRRAAALAAAVGAVLLVAAAAVALRPTQQARYEGEHGLAVHFEGDSVVVRWLTAGAQTGRLEVRTGERVIATVRTPSGFAHRAAFRRPAGDDDLLLGYGGDAADANRFETLIALRAPARPEVVSEPVDSVIVIGDTHGMYDALLDGLGRAGLIDEAGRWSGGRRHLVLAGDLMDRGPDVAALLWLVYRLEHEAARAGGHVHVLLGNHEIMVMMGDVRYVHPKEAEVARWHGLPYDRMYDVRSSLIGRWLASKPGVVRIGSAVITHGGLSAEHGRQGLRALDDSLRHFMSEELFYRWADTTYAVTVDSAALARRDNFFWSPESIFWHRAYVQSDTLQAELDAALSGAGGELLVVGHTAVDSIHERYGGRLLPAHTLRFGGEVVLLVREGERYLRYRVTERGVEPLGRAHLHGGAHPPD
jgi:hypothetical protein